MSSLSTARDLAVQSIREAQVKYKRLYDRKSVPTQLRVGDWVLPQDEVGKMRKLSRPWHGPYRVLTKEEPDVTVSKVYFPQDPAMRVHLSRVTPCPSGFPPGFYWYGSKRRSPGRPPKWVRLLDADSDEQETPPCVSEEPTPPGEDDPDEPQDTGDGSSEAKSEPADVTPVDRSQNRYSLRGRVSASRRLMTVQSRSRSSLSERGVM